jgi:hypothetical protein
MFKPSKFKRRATKDCPKQPRSGARLQPTAHAVDATWETPKPQRGERPVVTQSRTQHSKIALLACTLVCSMPLLRAQSPDLPPGPAQAKVRTACLECHDASIIAQQRLNKAAWTKEVDKMIKWGALVEAADRDSFIDYLSTNFPENKPPAEMPRTASTKKR